MSFLRDGLKKWVQAKKAAGFVALLNNSSDVRAVLETQRSSIDDFVIDELLTHSYYISKTESLEEGLRWAEAAHEASLLGGSAAMLARCFTSQSLLLLNLHRRDGASRSNEAAPPTSVRAYLDEALACAQNALDIFRDAGMSAELPPAIGLISTIYENRREALPALQHRFMSVLGWAELPDAADALPKLLDNLAGLFRPLDGDALTAGSKLVVAHLEALNEIASRWLDARGRGKVLEILGAAYRGLGSRDEVFHHWEQAVCRYREAGDTPEAFELLARMHKYGVEVERLDLAIRWGEECIKCAPDDLDLDELASRYHLLAVTYNWAGRSAEAAAAHHQAASLYLQDERSSVGAGGCLLQAAICEEEIGMFDKAREDLEHALQCAGGTYGFWLASTTLAKLLWRRYGNLGGAVEHADEAVQLAMSTPDQTLRAVSLYLSGGLHLTLGNNESALMRAEALLELSPESLHATTINLDRLYGHGVVPPPPTEAAMLAYLASLRLNRLEEARRYSEMCTSFAHGDYPSSGEEFIVEDCNDDALIELMQGIKCLARGEQLVFISPREALVFLEQAASLFRKHGALDNLVVAYRDLANAKFLLDDVEGVRACLREAMDLIEQAPNHTEEFTCRYLLGKVSAMTGDYESAYEYLESAVMLLEAERTSLGEDRQRLLFFEVGPYLDAYTGLVAMCVKTRRTREAVESIEKIKSRVFLDLLAQGGRGRIDYETLGEIHKLSKERDRWIRLHAAADAEQLGEWGHIAILQESISIRERTDGLQQQLHDEGLFVRFNLQDTPVTFGEIREICLTR